MQTESTIPVTLGPLGYSNLALVAANLVCLLIFVWAQYRRKVKYYDRSIRILEEEQGEWFVNFVIERELAKLFKHYTRDGADSKKAPAEDNGADEEEFECDCGKDPCECDCECGDDCGDDCECDDDCGDGCECECHEDECDCDDDCDDDCECECHEDEYEGDGEDDEDDGEDEDEEAEDEEAEDYEAEDEEAEKGEDDEAEDDEAEKVDLIDEAKLVAEPPQPPKSQPQSWADMVEEEEEAARPPASRGTIAAGKTAAPPHQKGNPRGGRGRGRGV